MLTTSIPTTALIGAVFLLAGLVKGVTGMGLPTVAMGLLAMILPPAEAAALLLIPSFVTNIWQLASGPSLRALTARLWGMMLGIALGTIAGACLLTGATAARAIPALGLALAVYASLGLLRIRFSTRPDHEPWLSPLVGVVTGLLTGATGVFVLPAVPYLQSLRLDRDALIQALGLSFTVSTLALGFGLLRAGVSAPPLAASASALIPALAGMLLGQGLRHRMSVETFRRVFFAGLSLLGLTLALKGIL